MRHIGVVRLVGGLALMLALFGATIATGSAQGAASITIHNRLCPTDYAGDDMFGDCHGNPQDAGLEFSIDGPVADSGATDGNGDITFSGLPAGTYGISGGVPGEFASTFVYCSINEDPNNAIPVTGTATGVSIDVPEGAAVICDWYNTPFDLSGNGDDGGDTPPTKLPNTGAGVGGTETGAANYLGVAVVLALTAIGFGVRRAPCGDRCTSRIDSQPFTGSKGRARGKCPALALSPRDLTPCRRSGLIPVRTDRGNREEGAWHERSGTGTGGV